MLRFRDRATRAATAGLLALLVAAPPASWADDHDRGKRSRGHAARAHEDRHEHEGRRLSDRNQRRRDDHGRNHRRELPARAQRHVERDRHEARERHEHRAPRVAPVPVARRDRHEHRDRSEWRDDRRREWRDDRREWQRERARVRERREEWREHQEWRDARWVALHGSRWHWHGDRWCPPGHRNPPGRRLGWYAPHDDWRWARYRRPVVIHSPYYCAPCAYWYQDRHAFDRHVYGHHGLGANGFEQAVAQLVWGLVYFGL
jgi:hypothetical protein